MPRLSIFQTVLTLFALGACAPSADNARSFSAPVETEAIPVFKKVTDQTQIGGGEDITDTDFPNFQFVAALGTHIQPDTFNPRCGGALIAEDWILTAAHCARNEWLVFGNRDLLGADGERHEIENRFCHRPRNLSSNVLENDIALLKINRSGSAIAPVALATDSSWESLPLTLAGWGDGAQSRNLQHLEVDFHPGPLCAVSFPPQITARTFCTIHQSGGALNRDSGGPVIVFIGSAQPVLVGIMNARANSATSQGTPNRHVRVTEYLPWIRRVMNGTAAAGEFDDC